MRTKLRLRLSCSVCALQPPCGEGIGEAGVELFVQKFGEVEDADRAARGTSAKRLTAR